MARINSHYLKLAAGYLFPEIGRRTRAFQEANTSAELIRLGIGDVVLPLPDSVREAMKRAVDEMGTRKGFRGYPPDQGYDFLRDAIIEHDYKARGIQMGPDEIFVSDGSKCDSGAIQEIFDASASLGIPDPVYPVYIDTNVMAGRTGRPDDSGRYAGVHYLDSVEANGFLPKLPDESVDLVYLCFPNNPTGSVATTSDLQRWVDWARSNDSILLFDAAYEAYITDDSIPHSIFEIPGARECSIEFRSYSKNVGFTGVRCGYVALPRELRGRADDSSDVEIHSLWARRHATKFNGVSYPVQAGAVAAYTGEGQNEVRANVRYYLENARVIREGLTKLGFTAFAGVNAPYIWLKTPEGLGSWEFFDALLERAHVVGTPGAGFGACGEGYFRLSAFGFREQIEAAIDRIQKSF